MNRSELIRWVVVVGLAVAGSIARAQTPQTQTVQPTLGDQVRQQMMRPGVVPGGVLPSSAMPSGTMSLGATQGGTSLAMGGMFGSRVTPMMFLSVEDVRYYLASQLDRLQNKRLKVGDIKADDGAITADIVTVDNSLVQRLKVDRRTGIIKYED